MKKPAEICKMILSYLLIASIVLCFIYVLVADIIVDLIEDIIREPETTQVEAVRVGPAGNTDYVRITPTTKTYYYIGNKQTKKYHLPSCSYLPSEDQAIRISRLSLYQYSDYTPCKHCNPQ